MVSLGAVLVRLLTSGGYGWFVQQRMFIPLVLASVVLLVFGGYEAIGGLREEQRSKEASRWSVAPAVGWLLLLPLVVLVMVAPTALGAAAATRVEAFTPTDQTTTFAPLDPSEAPIEMRVYDFLDRAIWDPERSLEGVPVRLEGLVVNDERAPGGFMLTRFMVSCCAADGIPLQVALRDTGQPLDDDTWVVADVIWRPPSTPYDQVEGPVVVEADVVSISPQPGVRPDPYESPY
ncbi:MAG: TIGR03943 family protein [Actinomycetota bacterium]